MNRLRALWDNLRSSLWFVPAILVAGAITLAILLIEAESYFVREQLVTRWPRLFGAGAEGARGMLSAIASSMITVAGVAFSITIVTFALASSQYTSRILRTFMRDQGNQAVLGVFLGVFAYCLVVLRTIRGGDDGGFVPSMAILAAVVLALIAIGFLVFFIHHVADLIQATSIIQAVAGETNRVIERLYPKPARESGLMTDPAEEAELPGLRWTAIPAQMTGYVQAVEGTSLLALAREHDTVLRMERGIGEFVIEGTPLVSLAGKQADKDLIRKVNAAYTTGRHRTIQHDPAYGIRQIVDIALKALSPGINDTTTAIFCIDHLGAVLVRLAACSLESAGVREDGRLRVIRRPRTYQGFVTEAFDQIRQNGEDNPAVLARLLETLAVISGQTTHADHLRALRQQVEAVVEAAERNISSAPDRLKVQAARERVPLTAETGTGTER